MDTNTPNNTATEEGRKPASASKSIIVHKRDAEGALTINSLTGIIDMPNDQRPEWSDGLTTALLAERHGYYERALGPKYSQGMAFPDMIAYEDLGWIAVNAEGDAYETEADAEHRAGIVAELLGLDMDTSAEAFDKSLGFEGVNAEVEIAMDRTRTNEEQAAFERSQSEGFDSKTGTNGG